MRYEREVIDIKTHMTEIRDQFGQAGDAPENSLAMLFHAFVKIEDLIDVMGQEFEEDLPFQQALDYLLEEQSWVMRRAMAVKATNPKDVLYKLALWRRDSVEANLPFEEMKRGEAVVYSAFLDLADQLGGKDVVNSSDQLRSALIGNPTKH